MFVCVLYWKLGVLTGFGIKFVAFYIIDWEYNFYRETEEIVLWNDFDYIIYKCNILMFWNNC